MRVKTNFTKDIIQKFSKMNRYDIALNKQQKNSTIKDSWNSYERESGQIFDFSKIIGAPPEGAHVCIYEAEDQNMVVGMWNKYYCYQHKKFHPIAKGHIKIPVFQISAQYEKAPNVEYIPKAIKEVSGKKKITQITIMVIDQSPEPMFLGVILTTAGGEK